MKTLLLNAALLLSTVAASLGYNMMIENKISELAEANIEALNQETQDDYPCLINPSGKCMEWVVISDGATGVVEYHGYINYMEVDE